MRPEETDFQYARPYLIYNDASGFRLVLAARRFIHRKIGSMSRQGAVLEWYVVLFSRLESLHVVYRKSDDMIAFQHDTGQQASATRALRMVTV